MERIQIIKNFLDLIGMTKDERVSLIQALMYEWHLTEKDIIISLDAPIQEADAPASAPESNTPSETEEQEKTQDIQLSQKENQVSEIPAPKKRGRPKKIKNDAPSSEAESPVEKSKKTRGRKKKNSESDNKPKTRRIKEKPIDNDNSKEDDIVNEDEAATKAALSAQDIENVLENEPETRSKETRRRNPNFLYLADFPDLKPLIIGQEHPFEFLYRWKDKNLLSPHVLDGMMPIGIYVRYKNTIFGKYKGFIVSIYEENIITNISEANQEAEKLPAIDDESWMVMNSLQWSVLKTYIGSVNHMLSKVGGDSLKNNYRTCSPKSNLTCGVGAFRYTIDVK